MKYSLLLATLAFAQADLERVYHFSNTSSPQSLNEIATIVRSMTDVPQLLVDSKQSRLRTADAEAAARIGQSC